MTLRIRLFLLLFCLGSTTAFGQSITYDLPEGFNRDISKADYKLIVDSSVSIISRRYTIDLVQHGTVWLTKSSGNGAFNLDNLILKCLDEKDRGAWGAIIHEHFDKIFSSIDQRQKLDHSSYESIRPHLGLRIYPLSFVEQRGGADHLVTRTDLDGTMTLLMLDLPGAFTAVTKEMFNLWGKDSAEVFAAALANVGKMPVKKVTKTLPFDGVNLELEFLGNEDYAASFALDLQNNAPEFVGEWGCALSIPNKGLVDLCKISKDKPLDFVKFIQMTKPFIEKSYREHPQPVSDQFFWYYKGTFTHIRVITDDKGNINVISPFGLTELMANKP